MTYGRGVEVRPGGRKTRCAVVAAAIVAVSLGVATERANAAYSVNVQNNVLTITGDAASDALALRLAANDPNTLQIDVGNNGTADFTANRVLFTQIVVNAGGGDDRVRIDEINGAFTDVEATTLNGELGNDTLTGGIGPETFLGGDGNDQVSGGRGNDVALLGIGEDSFTWAPGDGSDTIEGQAGTDALVFNTSNVSENIALSANGARLRLFRDVANIVMDTNGVERVGLHVLAGADNVTVNSLGGTDVTRVDVDLAGTLGGGAGDGAADTVILNGSAGADNVVVSASAGVVQARSGSTSVLVSHAEPAGDKLQVNTLAGNDLVAILPGATPLLRLNVDGGADVDRVVPTGTGAADNIKVSVSAAPAVDVSLDGGATFAQVLSEAIDAQGLGGPDTIVGSNGMTLTATSLTIEGGADADVIVGSDAADTLIGGDGNDRVSGGRGNDVAFLGAGDDTFTWAPGDGSDVVEGQAGADALAFNTSNVNENIDLSANGGRLRLFRDVANIVMDTNDVERVSLHVLGGADNVTVNSLAGTDVTRVDVDLEGTLGGGAGDGQPDTVTVNGTMGPDIDQIDQPSGKPRVVNGPTSVFVGHSEPANDVLNVNPLAGADVVALFPGVTPLLKLKIDGGTETDTVIPTGTAGADSVQLTPAPPAVNVSLDGGSAQVLAEKIDVQTLGGNDSIAGANGIAATLTSLILEGGEGADQIVGSDGPDIILGGDGADTVLGARGNDVALLGAGDDTFVWNPGDGSDTVEGQVGTDTLAFNGSNANENIALAPNGGRLRLFRDVANIVMDTNDVERVGLHVLGGVDNVTVNSLAGTDVTRVDVDLAATLGGGDGLADTVTVNGTVGPDSVGITPVGTDVRISGLPVVFVSHSEPANDKVQVNTLDGDDQVAGTVGLAALIQLRVDAGIGADTVRGGDGGDTLVGGDGNDSISGGPGTDFLAGGPGADQFSCGGPGDTLVTDAFDTVGPDCF